jgi:transcriptional regulator of acetoin/glycerol metabolism
MSNGYTVSTLLALTDNSRKINVTAEAPGISRKSLWEKMKRYIIER